MLWNARRASTFGARDVLSASEYKEERTLTKPTYFGRQRSKQFRCRRRNIRQAKESTGDEHYDDAFEFQRYGTSASSLGVDNAGSD
jgi:hypothetical protein